jgi:hypothetical protein
MNTLVRTLLVIVAASGLPQTAARAQDVQQVLTVTWETFWQQTGYPRPVYKWRNPLQVKFSGAGVDRHKAFAMRQLKEAADIAGLPITEVDVDDAAANVQVEFVSSGDALPDTQPCVTNIATRNGAIVRARVRAHELSIWRCMLHEAMHVMGIPGHPMGHSILTYFARSGRLTDIDKLLLKTIYSDEVYPDMSPFAVLPIVARRALEGVAETHKSEAQAAASVFLRETMRNMEEFGNGSGVVPSAVLRSSKATAAGLARGQTQIQFFIGLAYLNGHIVERDEAKALDWLRKAAAASHAGARRLLESVDVDASAAASDRSVLPARNTSPERSE